MSARILVVDDLAPNLHLFQVKLAAEYYDVLTARSGIEALEIAATEKLDLILMDAMMPGMNGFDACRRLKANPETWHIPVIMVTALEETKDRIRGLEAGADDFITKPIEDFNLMTRVKSLLRLKMVTDQLLSHTGHSISNSRPVIEKIDKKAGRIMIVEDHQRRAQKLAEPLGAHEVIIVDDPVKAIRAAKGNIDLIIVSLVSDNFDGLRVCASLRFNAESRETPILIVEDPENQDRLVRAYDIGVNDSVLRPVETQELGARVGTQLRRKFYADSLRENFNQNLEMVVADTLTGLGNRRYFDRGVEPLVDQLNSVSNTPFTVILFDIDHFKRVNDILGHDMGDHILKEVAARLVTNMRAVDIVSRYGGEEFMIAMPDTTEEDGYAAADRVRALIAGTPIYVNGEALTVTMSAGVAQARPNELVRDVQKRADTALYRAKHAGRNLVMSFEKKAA